MVRDGDSEEVYVYSDELSEFLRQEKNAGTMQFLYHLII